MLEWISISPEITTHPDSQIYPQTLNNHFQLFHRITVLYISMTIKIQEYFVYYVCITYHIILTLQSGFAVFLVCGYSNH